MRVLRFTKTKIGADYNRFYTLERLEVYDGDASVIRITTRAGIQTAFEWQGVLYKTEPEKPVFLFFGRSRYKILADGQEIGEMRIGRRFPTWKKTMLLLHDDAGPWQVILRGNHRRICQVTLQRGEQAVVYKREAKKSRLINSYDDQQIALGEIETTNSGRLVVLLGLVLLELDLGDRQSD